MRADRVSSRTPPATNRQQQPRSQHRQQDKVALEDILSNDDDDNDGNGADGERVIHLTSCLEAAAAAAPTATDFKELLRCAALRRIHRDLGPLCK